MFVFNFFWRLKKSMFYVRDLSNFVSFLAAIASSVWQIRWSQHKRISLWVIVVEKLTFIIIMCGNWNNLGFVFKYINVIKWTFCDNYYKTLLVEKNDHYKAIHTYFNNDKWLIPLMTIFSWWAKKDKEKCPIALKNRKIFRSARVILKGAKKAIINGTSHVWRLISYSERKSPF